MFTRAFDRIRLMRHSKLPLLCDIASTWYRGWYFDIRLEEEVSRSARYELPLTLIVLCLPNGPTRHSEQAKLNQRLAGLAITALRLPDVPAILNESEFAVLLPHTTRANSQTVIDRLTTALSAYSPALGSASYPEDGLQASELILAAEHRAFAPLLEGGMVPSAIPRHRHTSHAA